MIIRYCTKCAGKPYTTNWNMRRCPKDGSLLERDSVDPSDLVGRPCLDLGETGEEETGENEAGNSLPDDPHSPRGSESEKEEPDGSLIPLKDEKETSLSPVKKLSAFLVPVKSVLNALAVRLESGSKTSSSGNHVVLTGRVTNYSRSSMQESGYRRSWFTKAWHALRYGQRTTDVLHRFTLRVDNGGGACNLGSTGTIVNVHGIIAAGASINENDVVEVEGTYSPRTGVLFARQIIVNSGGRNAKVRFQHDMGSVPKLLLLAVVIAAALGLWYFCSQYSGSIMPVLVIGCVIALLLWLLNTRLGSALVISGCLRWLFWPLLIAVLAAVCLLFPSLSAGILTIAIMAVGIWILTKSVR